MPFHSEDPLEAHWDGDGRHWTLTKELHWTDPDLDWTIAVPIGFWTDLASVPRPFWPLFPRDGKYAPAAVLHDYLYWAQEVCDEAITRKYADGVLRRASGDLGVSWATRVAMWSGVRLAGGRRWARYQRARNAGLRKQEA